MHTPDTLRRRRVLSVHIPAQRRAIHACIDLHVPTRHRAHYVLLDLLLKTVDQAL